MTSMNTVAAMLTGTGLGCLAMYSLDPEMGRRRRAQARDKVVSLQKKVGEAAATTARDLRNRTLGTVAEGRSFLLDRKIDDDRLARRVRANLGFLVRYPSSVEAQANSGRVVLGGDAFADELEQLIDGILSLRGVRKVENRLTIHEQAKTFPGLQGELGGLKPKPRGRRIDLWHHHWSPSTRLIISITAATLLGLGALAFGRPPRSRRKISAATKLAGAARLGEKFIRAMRR
jgi:hypothetical protein